MLFHDHYHRHEHWTSYPLSLQSTIIVTPIAHAEFSGEDNGSNAFDEKVSSNYRTRTFWTLLLSCCHWHISNPMKPGKLFSHLHFWQSITHVTDNMTILGWNRNYLKVWMKMEWLLDFNDGNFYIGRMDGNFSLHYCYDVAVLFVHVDVYCLIVVMKTSHW